jgi:hypothetical protein
MPAILTTQSTIHTSRNRTVVALGIASLVISLIASACGSSASSASNSTSVMAQGTKLAQGTIGLENTSLAVDSAMAAQLLPLWQLLADLVSSSTAASEEKTAVVEEIQATMTTEQLDAIEKMDLNEVDNGKLTSGAGSSVAAAQTNSQAGSQTIAAATGATIGDGGMPPADGSGMPMDGGMPSGAPASGSGSTTTTMSVMTSGGTEATTAIRQVISLLQEKLQS